MPIIKFTIITLFPEAIRPYLDSSMLYKAQDRGIIEVEYVNLREFGLGPHRSVDDTPYGGGDGMLLRCEPIYAAIESIKQCDPRAKVILPTPVGETWNQSLARQFAGLEPPKSPETRVEALEASILQKGSTIALTPKTTSEGVLEASDGILSHTTYASATIDISSAPSESSSKPSASSHDEDASTPHAPVSRHYIILCPHYEGYDERIMSLIDYPISLGNYVLTGGELPALIIIDSITRLLPGVLGGATSVQIESFSDGDNLEFPQYTKPAVFRGMAVPEVLLSGHHGKVAQWRAEHAKRQSDKTA